MEMTCVYDDASTVSCSVPNRLDGYQMSVLFLIILAIGLLWASVLRK